MPNTQHQSNIVAGFLLCALDLARGDPEAQQRISQTLREIEGEHQPRMEEERREALARWVTHRWAPISLDLAGLGDVAERVRSAQSAEEAANILADPGTAVPPPPTHRHRMSLEDLAGNTCALALEAGWQITQTTSPALAAQSACRACRVAHAAGTYHEPLGMADEITAAARSAMAGNGPSKQEPGRRTH